MNLIILVWNYLKSKPLTTALNIVLLALGISVITMLLLFNNQLRENISSNSKGIDLVVGAKGSPLQLILCSIFHADFPTGNIRLRDADKVARHRMVKKATPLALGDSYNGNRIVGTSVDYVAFSNAELAAGEFWKKDMEVTLGSNVAFSSGLKFGDSFASAHGLTPEGHPHEENRYVVKGILKRNNSVIDNLILTNIESVWRVHGITPVKVSLTPQHPSLLVPGVEGSDSVLEVTSLLIQYRNPLAAIQLPRFVNGVGNLQAASPAFETARLFSILGVGFEVLRGFAMVLILISGLSIFIALYSSLKERQYDLAIMRSMGSSRSKLFIAIVMEGSFLTLLSSLLGLLLGHGVLWLFVTYVDESKKAGLTAGVLYLEEAYVLLLAIGLGLLCSIIPAVMAYRTDIHKVLAGN